LFIMSFTVTNYPLFHLSEKHYQAEVALSVLICFGNQTEKKTLKPQAAELRKAYVEGNPELNLFDSVAEILQKYISEYGALSELLESYLKRTPELLNKVYSNN